ncbi:hypothetical protein PMAYCL1PPCAC_25150, partial [Pristionchus mayeri]
QERLALELSSWSPDGRVAIGAAERLVAPREGRPDADAESHLAHYGRVRACHVGTAADADAARSCPLPCVDAAATRVICGERPLAAEVIAGRSGDEEKWRDMERAAFHAIAGTSTGFRPTHIVSDADTDNTSVRETPAGERFRVQLRLRNPLSIPLQLRDVHLGVANVQRREEGAGEEHFPFLHQLHHHHEQQQQHHQQQQPEGIRLHHIDSLHLQPEEARMISCMRELILLLQIELWAEPSASVAAFRVSSLRYALCCGTGVPPAAGEIPLECRGKRLNKTEKQMKSVTYATDERLRALVAARAWPLCDVRATRAPAHAAVVYTDQLLTLRLEITNSGSEPVEGLALAMDTVDRVMVEEQAGGEGGEGAGTLSLPVAALDLHATPGVRAFALRRGGGGSRLEPGAKTSVVVKLRAPSQPTASAAVSLLLLYRGAAGGATREWRTRLEWRVARLLDTDGTRVLDPYHGLVALGLRNALTSDDVAMARVECTRVRVAVAARHRGSVALAPEHGLAAVRSAVGVAEGCRGEMEVRLETTQSQEVCVRIGAPGADADGASGADAADWTLIEGEMPPDWPLPVPEEDPERIEWGRRRLLIGVAWRANIVGKDGMVHSILGESFVPDPFAAAGLHIAGLQLGFSLDTPGGVASPIPVGDEDEAEGGGAAPPIYVSVVPLQPIEHDFRSKSICEFPVTLVVRNECGRARMADVELRMKPKVRDPPSPPSPPPRQQWWLARECLRTRVPSRDTVQLRVMVRVTQPSAYDLLGSQMTCTVRMEGEERSRTLRVPPLMAVVYAAYGGEQA